MAVFAPQSKARVRCRSDCQSPPRWCRWASATHSRGGSVVQRRPPAYDSSPPAGQPAGQPRRRVSRKRPASALAFLAGSLISPGRGCDPCRDISASRPAKQKTRARGRPSALWTQNCRGAMPCGEARIGVDGCGVGGAEWDSREGEGGVVHPCLLRNSRSWRSSEERPSMGAEA